MPVVPDTAILTTRSHDPADRKRRRRFWQVRRSQPGM